jgi:hypothetical protein
MKDPIRGLVLLYSRSLPCNFGESRVSFHYDPFHRIASWNLSDLIMSS